MPAACVISLMGLHLRALIDLLVSSDRGSCRRLFKEEVDSCAVRRWWRVVLICCTRDRISAEVCEINRRLQSKALIQFSLLLVIICWVAIAAVSDILGIAIV